MYYESDLHYQAIVTHIWPEALALVDKYAEQTGGNRSFVARQVIQNYRRRDRDVLPYESEIGSLYGVELPYKGMAEQPTLSFRPYTEQRKYLENIARSFGNGMRRWNSVSEVSRRIIAFEVVQL